MAFPKFHGITLANNSWIENVVVESLASDPVAANAGRVWYNTTSKTWNASFLDAGGAVVVRTFNTAQDFNAFVADLASTAATKGTNLVGYEGKAGANDQFSIAASTLKASLDSIVDAIDAAEQAIEDIGTGNLANMQTEIDTTQTGAGLSATGTYVATGAANYISGATSLNNATVVLDTALKTEADARILADSNIQSELDATQAGAGLSTAGAYVANSGANYIKSANTLNGADVALDTALKTEETARSTADTAIRNDFASTANAKGASLVGVEDAAGLLTATNVEAALAELHGDITGVGFQQVYDQSTVVGGEVVVTLAEDKILKFKDNNDNTYFSLDPDGTNPIKVSMSGSVAISGDTTITGNLTVTGATTEITSTVNNADHWVIAPAGAPAALVINPDALFTGDTVVDIKAQNNGTSVLVIDKTDATVETTKLTSSVSFVANGSTDLNAGVTLGADATFDAGANVLANLANGVANQDAVTVSQLNTAISDAAGDVSALQTELDTTQTGAGLSATGTYVVPTTSNYINSTSSLANAASTLDAALKTEADARILAASNLQTELDTTQTGAGLSATGTYVATGAANYISAATSLNNATVVLDTALKTEADARILADSNIQSELDATQTGAGLSAAGAYVVTGAANYISAATSLNNATVVLDTALKTEADARTLADTAIRTDINNQIYTLETSVAALTHTVTHNLNTAFVNYTVWIKGADGTYRNDIVAVTETSANVLTVDLTESRNIKIAVRKVATI